MNINKLRVYGNPNIGVYIFANDKIAITPPGLNEDEKKLIIETLNVELIETKIADTILVGVMIAGNNNGIILPRNTRDEEYTYLKNILKHYGLNVEILRSKNTALGNLVLVNDSAAIVGSELERSEIMRVRNALDVEVFQKDILYLTIPGSLAVVTNNGGVIHPDVSDEELKGIEKILKVPFERATVNSGIPFIKTGLIANTYGALVGELTTGPEILRIQRGLASR